MPPMAGKTLLYTAKKGGLTKTWQLKNTDKPKTGRYELANNEGKNFMCIYVIYGLHVNRLDKFIFYQTQVNQ